MANIFIPLINKSKAQAIQSVDNGKIVQEGLALLSFLIVLRAQMSVVFKSQVDQDKLAQLDSMKWVAGLIARTQEIRDFAYLLAIADTLQYSIGLNKSVETNAKTLKDLAIEQLNGLREDKPKPGCRVLPPAAINASNIRSHQFGLVAQCMGKWQATALYTPNLVIKNVPIATLDFGTFTQSYFILMENLGLRVDDELKLGTGLIQFITSKLYSETCTFNDAIIVGSDTNKLPLESPFPVQRALPSKVPVINVPSEDQDDPLIKLLTANVTQITTKAKPSPDSSQKNSLNQNASTNNNSKSKKSPKNKKKKGN